MTQFELVVQLFLALSRLFRCCARKDSKQFPLLQGKSCLAMSSRYIYTRITIIFIVIGKGPALVVVAVFEHLTSHTLLRVEGARVNSSPPHGYEYEYEYEYEYDDIEDLLYGCY